MRRSINIGVTNGTVFLFGNCEYKSGRSFAAGRHPRAILEIN